MIEYLYEENWGTEIILEIKEYDTNGNLKIVDISGATEKQYRFRKPDGTIIIKNADFKTDGTNGQLSYIIEEGLLDVFGMWQLQGYVKLSTGAWYTSSVELPVKNNLD